jgi:hypothetical protein
LNIYRLLVVVDLVPFIVAFFAPAHDYTVGHSNGLIHGFELAGLGFLGPFERCFAWYANIPFIYCGWKMICGEPPPKLPAWIAMALALTAFAPQYIFDFEVTGKSIIHWYYGPAVWLWVSCFPVVVIAAHTEPVLRHFPYRK